MGSRTNHLTQKQNYSLYKCSLSIYVGAEGNFAPQSNSTSQGLPYDLDSIMHFPHNAFSLNHHLSTIIPQKTGILRSKVGKSDSATHLDFLHINLLYCGGKLRDNFLFNKYCIF